VNQQFGTDLNGDNILPTSDPDPTQMGGQVNVDFGVNSANAGAIQAGRYAPKGLIEFLTGYGPSLHVVAGPRLVAQVWGARETDGAPHLPLADVCPCRWRVANIRLQLAKRGDDAVS
jgi:hypothetical protein